jgi:threonine synthase
VPDVVVVPCGNGSLLAAIYKAFWELKQLGLVERFPRLIGVQIRGASPLKQAYELGQPFVVVESPADSIAEAIVASESYSSPKVMKALQATGGTILEVDDDELYSGLYEVMETEGLIPEPSSGAAFAAISLLKDKNLLENSLETVVIVNTAGGVKNAALLAKGSRAKRSAAKEFGAATSLQR